MKSTKTVRILTLVLTLLLLLLLSVSCGSSGLGGDTESPSTTAGAPVSDGDTTEPTLPDRWKTATYTEDKTFGEGAKTVEVEVVADGYSVTFTVKTDEEYLGAALVAHGLIVGTEGPYGLYIDSVNGIVANYDEDQTYWAISKSGSYLMTGVDATEVENGAHYELTRTKG